jgi:hypothetical protein
MNTQSANTAVVVNKPALPVILPATRETILDAIRVLYSVVAGRGENLPSWDACGLPECDRIVTRAYKALEQFEKHAKEERIAQFRQGCKEVCIPYIKEAHKAAEEFSALSPTLKAMVRLPENVSVPVASFGDVFPQGTDAVKLLKDLGFTVAKKGETFSVLLPFPKAKV